MGERASWLSAFALIILGLNIASIGFVNAAPPCPSLLSPKALEWVSQQTRDAGFFIRAIQVSPDLQKAIRTFVGSDLNASQDATDHFLAFLEKLQSIADSSRQNEIENLMAQRLFEIQKEYKQRLGERNDDPHALEFTIRGLFAQDDANAFSDRLLAAASGSACSKKLFHEKQVKQAIRTRSVTERVMPHVWLPKSADDILWIPEVARNPDYLFALLENSIQFRKIVVDLIRASEGDSLFTLRSSSGELYLALLELLVHPGKSHRQGLARTLGRFVSGILEMYGKPESPLKNPRTFGALAESFFNRDTRENWSVLFQDVLKEDDQTDLEKPSLIVIPQETRKPIVLAKNFERLWSQVDLKISYLDGQIVDPKSKTQIPEITQPTIINETEAWSKDFQQKLSQIDAELADFQNAQNIIFEFQIEFLKRSKEMPVERMFDDESFVQFAQEFARTRLQNYRDLNFALDYFRKLTRLTRTVYQEWNHPRNSVRERQKLLEIVRFNILPPMRNVEFASLIKRFRRLLLRGKSKVVDYDSITRALESIDRSGDFSYVPKEKPNLNSLLE